MSAPAFEPSMHCKRCLYPLVEVTTRQCPECGRWFHPDISQSYYRKAIRPSRIPKPSLPVVFLLSLMGIAALGMYLTATCTYTVVVSSGLAAGERICLTPLAVTIDGMRVSILDAEPQDQADTPATAGAKGAIAHAFAGYRSMQ